MPLSDHSDEKARNAVIRKPGSLLNRNGEVSSAESNSSGRRIVSPLDVTAGEIVKFIQMPAFPYGKQASFFRSRTGSEDKRG